MQVGQEYDGMECTLDIFKQKVNDSLPLLSLLGTEDKQEVWKFWRTVSSAVKIAVNGKGDIVKDSYRRNHFNAFGSYAPLPELISQHKHLDDGSIIAYIPENRSESRKFQLVKITNQEGTAALLESLAVEHIEINSCDGIEQSEPAGSNVSNTFHDAGSKEETITKSASLGGSDVNPETVITIVCEESAAPNQIKPSNHTPKHHKPVKIAWPPSRPKTRSCSTSGDAQTTPTPSNLDLDHGRSRGICFQNHQENNDSIQEGESIDEKGIEEQHSTLPQNSIEKSRPLPAAISEAVTNVLNGDMVIQISDGSDRAESATIKLENVSTSDTVKSEPYSSSQTSVTVEEQTPKQLDSEQMTLNSNETVTFEPGDGSNSVVLTVKSELPDNQNTEDMKSPMKGPHFSDKNASDIQTIITALEEELKKTGSEIDKINTSKPMTIEYIETPAGEMSHTLTYPASAVQFLDNQQVVEYTEVQNFNNVIWDDCTVQVLGDEHHDTGQGQGQAADAGQAGYDVVELEVEGDKRVRRGRKKKVKMPATPFEKDDKMDRTCAVCHRVLTYASSMAAHMRTHTGVRPYSCSQCQRKFTTKANKDRHEATHVGLKPFQCEVCKKNYTEKRSLSVHMRIHKGERPFVCTVCGKAFTQKCTLEVHMDRHTNKKGHLCDLCGKAFRQKCQLDVHVLRHKRQANFPCTHCSVKCFTKGDLDRHMIKHTGERPYQCSECPRAFTRKQYLVDHENTHFGRKPYTCSECGVSFHDMSSCHRHIRKHKQEAAQGGNKTSGQSAVLSSGDFHRILEGTQIGQVLKLEDGSQAVVKAVECEADGSTVYHITCINEPNSDPAGVVAELPSGEARQQQAVEAMQSQTETPLIQAIQAADAAFIDERQHVEFVTSEKGLLKVSDLREPSIPV